jgi:hypothetical protein
MKPPNKSSNSLMLEWHQRPGIVYFFRAGRAIKVGVTTVRKNEDYKRAIKRRQRSIQTHNHELVELLGAILFTGGETPTFLADTREREIHNLFVKSSIFKQHTVGGEWFWVSNDLLDYIKANAQTPEELGLEKTIGTLATTGNAVLDQL